METTPAAPEQSTSDKSGGNNELSPAQDDRVRIFETSEELQELCRDNGLSATQFARKGPNVTTLDMFLGFWGSMKSVMFFPALRELSIIKHPTITVMEGIEHCPNLELLCITECGLERITNLENCRKIRKLNLSSNKICTIEQLDTLDQLEILWLNDNQLSQLDGLWKLTQLKQFWVCRNRIERIDSALSCCVSLTELNFADNRLCNFKSLLSLASLDQLAVLTLSDPHYGDNPVCKLCNYQTYLMCHLNRLTCLDTVELSTRNKQIAEATMIKKKMYYNMRIKAIKCDIRARIKHSENIRNQAEQQIETSLAALVRQKKEIERYIADLSDRDAKEAHADCQATRDLRKKLECVDACLQSKYSTIYRMNTEFDRLRAKLLRTSDINISRLLLELETGGNIRLEDGKPSDAWFASCVDLIRSRLFANELQLFGVQDICITRITRINNRYLRHRFHSRMDEILTVPEQQLKANVSKKGVTVPVKEPEEQTRERDQIVDPHGASDQTSDLPASACPGATLDTSLEYLFYMQPPLLDQQRRNQNIEQFFASENGFRDPSEYGNMGIDGAIKLSNSVALLDSSRLAAALALKDRLLQKKAVPVEDLCRVTTAPVLQQQKGFTKETRDALQLAASGEWELPSGVLLVVKVFPGHTKWAEDDGNAFPSPHVHARDYTGLQSLQIHTRSSATNSGSEQHSSTRQKLYYMFDKALVLPEYLVEYQYVLRDSSSKGPLHSVGSSSATPDTTNTPRSSAQANDTETGDLGVVAKLVEDFERKYRTRRSPCSKRVEDSPLNGDNIMRVLQMEPTLPAPGVVDYTQLVSTRLNSVKINRLRHLNLLGCGLESIPDLTCLKDHLEVLVLSYNSIQSLNHHFDGLSKLRHLDVSFNQLARLEHLDHCDLLQSLEVNSNHLKSFDDVEYLGRVFRGRAFRQLDLRKNSMCENKRYRLHVLQHLPVLDCLNQQRVTKDEILCAQQLITKLSSAKIWDFFYRSKFISVSTNFGDFNGRSEEVTVCSSSNNKPELDDEDHQEASRSSPSCLSAFQPCWNAIEELNLNRELIQEIEGLDLAVNLRVASFADNVIKRINGLKYCTKLEELSLEDNEIAKIENLEALICLKKLHLGRNRITTIECLDKLENLTQLSLEENQITSLRGLGSALKLMELYIGHNRIEILKEIQHLKPLPKLTILDLSGNDITSMPDYRLYAVYYLRRVKVLDGVSISPQDQSDAKQKYSGKLTMEFILEKCAGSGSNEMPPPSGNATHTNNLNPSDRIQEMNLSSCRIREIGSIPGTIFTNVRELNLENNQISDISGLETLPKLRILNLNRNRIDKLLPTSSASTYTIPEELDGKGILACLHLEQLYLAYNQINDMTMLGLQFLDELKGNSIVFLAGLDNSTELRELRLDKNRIRQLDATSTIALHQLRILSMEDNGLKSLANFNNLLSLKALDLSNNRLVDLDEVEKLASIPTLIDLRLINNPLTKKHLYRQTLLYKLQFVKNLDTRDISIDERERINALFVHERAAAVAIAAPSSTAYTSSNSNGDRYIEARVYTSANTPVALAPATIPSKASSSSNNNNGGVASTMALTSSTTRFATIPQISSGEVLSGSLLRKHPGLGAGVGVYSQNPNQLSVQPINSFPKPDHPIDAGIAIAPSNTTTKSLLSHTQAASYRNPNSLTNQPSMIVNVNQSAIPLSASSPSSIVTVASAFSVALPNGFPTDHFHLGGLRSDRRRMSSVHYDQALNTMQVGAPALTIRPPSGIGMSNNEQLKLPIGIVSSHAVIRGGPPASLSNQGVPSIQSPLASHKATPTPLSAANHPQQYLGDATMANRDFSGYGSNTTTTLGNHQKRYSAYQEFHPESSIPYLSTKLNPNNAPARPR
uniref:Protein phosphatase 1 regulatory subunit 7 n=1 Tax=Globisporangium ultimum (strain ATCC 200006 / CBS 805.95 / DAOM BR144) TaxID=431595 RepID=K3X2D6_GLOUD